MTVEPKMPKGYVCVPESVLCQPACYMGELGTHNKVVHEPGQGGAEHGLPVALDDEPVRNMLLHSVLLVLGRVDESQSEEEQYHW